MDTRFRIVTHLPLRELWRDDGFSTTARGKSLGRDDVHQLLKSGRVQFVIADVGVALLWIPADQCFRFWKDEANPHLANRAKVHLAEFRDGYCYFATRWEGLESEAPIVLLEKNH